jgi:chromatin modification-related protein EAF6
MSGCLQENSQPPSATSTPSHAPTPTSSFPHSARDSNHPTPTSTSGRNGLVNNKKKKAPDDDELDTKSTKRGKISYGRD